MTAYRRIGVAGHRRAMALSHAEAAHLSSPFLTFGTFLYVPFALIAYTPIRRHAERVVFKVVQPIRRLSPAYISGDVRPESCHTSARWRVD